MAATACIQCALEAFVAGKPPDTAMFDESPEQHLARVHPDPEVTQRRRIELEQLAREKIAKMKVGE